MKTKIDAKVAERRVTQVVHRGPGDGAAGLRFLRELCQCEGEVLHTNQQMLLRVLYCYGDHHSGGSSQKHPAKVYKADTNYVPV